VNEALDLARDCEAAYGATDGQTRRLWNQAFFDCFKVGTDDIEDAQLVPHVRDLTSRGAPRRLARELSRGRATASSRRGSNRTLLAEGEGFEPPDRGTRPTAFKAVAHLGTRMRRRGSSRSRSMAASTSSSLAQLHGDGLRPARPRDQSAGLARRTRWVVSSSSVIGLRREPVDTQALGTVLHLLPESVESGFPSLRPLPSCHPLLPSWNACFAG
jgi:hypothetical protein